MFSQTIAFKQTQTGLLTALNLFSLFTTLQLHCSCVAILIFEQVPMDNHCRVKIQLPEVSLKVKVLPAAPWIRPWAMSLITLIQCHPKQAQG